MARKPQNLREASQRVITIDGMLAARVDRRLNTPENFSYPSKQHLIEALLRAWLRVAK